MPKLESIWVCIQDPSGDFTGRQFSLMDLQYTASLGNWTTGTKFYNLANQRLIATYENFKILIGEQTYVSLPV